MNECCPNPEDKYCMWQQLFMLCSTLKHHSNYQLMSPMMNIVAAVNYVEVCNQHVAFLSEMGDTDITSLQEMQTGNCPLSWSIIQYLYTFQVNAKESKVRFNASFALLPGKVLHLSALIVAQKFRDRGNKSRSFGDNATSRQLAWEDCYL